MTCIDTSPLHRDTECICTSCDLLANVHMYRNLTYPNVHLTTTYGHLHTMSCAQVLLYILTYTQRHMHTLAHVHSHRHLNIQMHRKVCTHAHIHTRVYAHTLIIIQVLMVSINTTANIHQLNQLTVLHSYQMLFLVLVTK